MTPYEIDSRRRYYIVISDLSEIVKVNRFMVCVLGQSCVKDVSETDPVTVIVSLFPFSAHP